MLHLECLLKQYILEELRLLSNLESSKKKLIQIILVGQPELLDTLSSPSLLQFTQRVSVKYHITPLNLAETVRYITYRLKIAGLKDSIVFTEQAIKIIHKYSRGIPRMINKICDTALLAGYVKEFHTIDHVLLEEAIADMPPEFNTITATRVNNNNISLTKMRLGAYN